MKIYFKQLKNTMQFLEKKYISYPEFFKKLLNISSLTYWKSKNTNAQNVNKLLIKSKFGQNTTYQPSSMIRRIETR